MSLPRTRDCMRSNNELEPSVNHRGPRLAAARRSVAPAQRVVRLHVDTAPHACPRCTGAMEYVPPPKHTGFLAYVGGEFTFWIVAVAIGGAASCAANENYWLSWVLGGIAAALVF